MGSENEQHPFRLFRCLSVFTRWLVMRFRRRQQLVFHQLIRDRQDTKSPTRHSSVRETLREEKADGVRYYVVLVVA